LISYCGEGDDRIGVLTLQMIDSHNGMARFERSHLARMRAQTKIVKTHRVLSFVHEGNLGFGLRLDGMGGVFVMLSPKTVLLCLPSCVRQVPITHGETSYLVAWGPATYFEQLACVIKATAEADKHGAMS
jgi:hypothetical protein